MDKEKLTALVNRAKTGDQQAMEYLLRYAHTTVSYQCRKFLKNEQDAEDMTQEVLLTVYEKLDRLEQPGAFIPWVNRIAATRCINAINRAHPEYQFAEDEEGHSVLDNLEEMDAQRVPDKALDNKETARMIEEIIDSLPAPQRICTYLFYYDQLSVKEIARITKVSENTVKSRLNYARKAIKEDVLDYEKKGIKLYSLSPLPFLLYFLRRSAAYSADPAAARAAAQAVVSGSAATVAAGSSATDSARSSGKYAKSSRAKAAKSAPAGKAAVKTSGALSGMVTKIAAGVAAVAVTVGGAGYAVSHSNVQEATEPVSTQSYVVTETAATQPDIPTTTVPPVTATEEPTEAAIAAEPYTMLRATIDTTGYDCEMYLETPEFAETTDGYKKINKFFADMRDGYLNGEDEKVGFMFERMEQGTGDGTYGYTQTCTVRCQTEHFVSVSYSIWWFVSATNVSYATYTFDAQTGELLELTDLINGSEQEIVDYIISLYDAEGYNEESYIFLPTEYSRYLFYIEDNQVWVRPTGEAVSALIPYIALPGELS